MKLTFSETPKTGFLATRPTLKSMNIVSSISQQGTIYNNISVVTLLLYSYKYFVTFCKVYKVKTFYDVKF